MAKRQQNLGAFTAVTVFSTTLSIALFNYIDNISKDVSNIDGNHSKIKSALISLTSLKREVILNAVLILTLFVIELAIEGVAKSIDLKSVPFESFYWVAISVRVSIFVLAILAVTEQIRGLMVAIEYRNVIHEGIGSSKRKN